MAPRQYVTEERGRHDKDEKQHPGDSSLHIHISPVIQATPYVPIQADEKETSPVGVYSSQKPARVDVPENMSNGGKGQVHVRGVVHGEK